MDTNPEGSLGSSPIKPCTEAPSLRREPVQLIPPHHPYMSVTRKLNCQAQRVSDGSTRPLHKGGFLESLNVGRYITPGQAGQGNRKRWGKTQQVLELGAKGKEWLGKGQQVETLCIWIPTYCGSTSRPKPLWMIEATLQTMTRQDLSMCPLDLLFQVQI